MGSQRVRILVLGAAIALVVLGCASEEQAPESDVLAVIKGKPITTADMDVRLSGMAPEVAEEFSSPSMLSALVDREIKLRVWAEAARETGIAETEEFKTMIAIAERSILAELYSRYLDEEAANISEKELQEAYERDKHLYSVNSSTRVRHILCTREQDALVALEAIRGGMSFADAVIAYSKDAYTKGRAGDMGLLTSQSAVPGLGVAPEFVDALAGIKEGEVGGPIRSSIGYHIVKVESRTEGQVHPFSEVRGQIQRRLVKERTELGKSDILKRLWEKYDVTVNNTSIKRYIGYPTTPEEFMSHLREATSSGDKITLSKEMVRQFPDNKYAPYAQFTMGFVFSEELHNYAEAEMAFRELLEKYPDSNLAGAARWMIANMGGEHPPLRNVEDVMERARRAGG